MANYTITGFIFGDDNLNFKDTTYGNATTSEDGLMSSADKERLEDAIQDITVLQNTTAVETGTPTIRIRAGNTELSKTVTTAYYKKYKNFVYLYMDGTFGSSANGGVYMNVLSGAPDIPADHCFLTGTIIVDGQPVFPLHVGAAVYFRLADNTNYQGASIAGKSFKISLLYVVG